MASRSVATTAAGAPLPAVIANYAICNSDPGEVAEIVRENLGGAGIGQFDLDRIKVPSGGGMFWSVPSLEGERPMPAIEGVVLKFTDQRAFWKDEIGASGGGQPPDCFSLDMQTGVGTPGGNCQSCPFAQFGSKIDGKGQQQRGQACKAVRLLYILTPDSILPAVVPVPPSSLKTVRSYFLRLAGLGVPYWAVATRLKLIKAKSGGGIDYAQIQPELAGKLAPDEQARVRPLRDMLATTIDAAPVAASDYAEAA